MKCFVKKMSLMLVLMLCLSCLAACGAPSGQAPEEPPSPSASEEMQDPVPSLEPEVTLEPENLEVPGSSAEPEPTPEPEETPDPVPVVDEVQFRNYALLCKELGAFSSPEEISGAAFFRYYRYRLEYTTEEEPAVSSTGKEYVRTVHTFDLNAFDACSAELFGVVFDYSAVPAELNSNLFRYEYDAESHSIREITDGAAGGGGSGVSYYAQYDGYSEEDNRFYKVFYIYIGTTDYGEREFETGVTGTVHLEYEDGSFRIRSHEIHGELTYEVP